MSNTSFYQKKRKELLAECQAALSLLDSATTFQNKNGYIFVTCKENKKLFACLDTLQFFKFQSTNKKKAVVGVHQIVLWLNRGVFHWRYHRTQLLASGATEVHHLNSITSDNRIENLTYVTPQQNSLCANAVLKPYHGLRHLNSANIKHCFEYGGGASDTAALIRKTMVCTLVGCGFVLEQIPSVAHILLQLPYQVGKRLFRSWHLSWI